MSTNRFEADPELLRSGGESSQYAGDSARKAAVRLSESSVQRGIFGDFDAAHAFHSKISAGRERHVQRLNAHHFELSDIADKVREGARRVLATDTDGAKALSATRDSI